MVYSCNICHFCFRVFMPGYLHAKMATFVLSFFAFELELKLILQEHL